MIARREWLRQALAQGVAAWAAGNASNLALAQTAPAAKKGSTSRYTVKKPSVSRSKDAPRAESDRGPLSLKADERLNRVLAPIRDGHQLPGLIAAIVRGDRLTAIGAAGVRKLGSEDPIRVTDLVHLGSCTKAMTATLIGTLVDEGLLAWSSTIRSVFPEVASRLHPDFQAATLSHLLTHRAGLPHDAGWWRLPGRTNTDKRRAALLELMGRAPLSKPGTTYAYSNAGYVFAGLMAEQITGRPWEDLIRDRVFEPLGMSSAGFGPPGMSDHRGDRGGIDQPWGHRDSGGRVDPVREDNAPCMGPAGTVHCSVPDWGKFAALHLKAAQGKPRILKPATFRALHTPPPGQEYAGGWYVVDRPWSGGLALNHNGSNLTWYASIWIAPARDLATLVATNLGGDRAAAAVDEATQGLIGFALDGPLRSRTRR
jgi:CubicO group peptidase (beta-lactamase class C family)